MLKEILSITGKPGLSKLITGGKKMIVVESLLDAKRFPIHSHEKVVSLADIAIYTETAEVPLREVLQKIQEKEGGKVSIKPKTTSNEDIKKYFAEIFLSQSLFEFKQYDRSSSVLEHASTFCPTRGFSPVRLM